MSARIAAIYDKHGEKLRFLVVGFGNTLISYGIFWVAITTLAGPLEVASGLDPKTVAVIVQWATWLLAVVVSTTTMKYFAFRSKGPLAPQVFRAYFIYLPAQGLSTAILWGSMHFLGLSAVVGQLMAIVTTTVFSYFGHKYFTFRIPLEIGDIPPEDLLGGSNGSN